MTPSFTQPLSLAGRQVGKVRLAARLGAGGMGEVYQGWDERLERQVAVKTIRAEQRLEPEMKARFLREARLLSKLGHPAICQVYDLVEEEDADFLIFEYVPGRTLKEVLAAGPLPATEALQIAEKIAEALAAAHRERIVHRDLKPENVMVLPDGAIKILDFGISRAIEGKGASTPPAPSPADGKGENPFGGGSPLRLPGAAPPPSITKLDGLMEARGKIRLISLGWASRSARCAT